MALLKIYEDFHKDKTIMYQLRAYFDVFKLKDCNYKEQYYIYEVDRQKLYSKHKFIEVHFVDGLIENCTYID